LFQVEAAGEDLHGRGRGDGRLVESKDEPAVALKQRSPFASDCLHDTGDKRLSEVTREQPRGLRVEAVTVADLGLEPEQVDTARLYATQQRE
jgi:hypothetical protein